MTAEAILKEIESEARREPFPVDLAVYAGAGKDALTPIAFAGNPRASICSLGRDLGRDEVRFGQPQVGAAGKLVRRGVLKAMGKEPDPDDSLLEGALEHLFLCNLVPFKPPGNKAYAGEVRERFRPYVERILTCLWEGEAVITLGTEAFFWFARYAEPGAAAEYWKREDRYAAEFPCVLPVKATEAGLRSGTERRVRVCPLPHPSPLNQRWVRRFPDLLAARLARWLPKSGT